MRVIFMGTPEFAVPTLNAIVEAGHEVVLVVAQPDRRQGRGKKLQSPPVAARAKELGLPLEQPTRIKTGAFPAMVEALRADVAVVLAYGRILTQRLLDAPSHGCINVHASLLPRWRGAAPIQAAILAGDEETGVCTQQMVAALDEGPVFHTLRTPLSPEETGGTLHDRLMGLSAQCAVETLAMLPDAVPTPQGEGATYIGKIAKSDGKLDLQEDAVALDRRVRAMTPWPGGQLPWGDKVLKIKAAAVAEGSGSPGEILSVDPLVVACGHGALRLDQVQAPGRKAVSGRDFANGARLAPGMVL